MTPWFPFSVLIFLAVFSFQQAFASIGPENSALTWRSVLWLALAVFLAIIAVLLLLGKVTA